MCAALSPTPPDSSTSSSISNCDNQTIHEKNGSIESTDKLPQTAFLRSFETELDKVDEYFQTKAPDVRQAVLTSLQGMYHQNEWPDNPLTIICRDLDIHVPTSEQLSELKATRDALKAEYDNLHLMATRAKVDETDFNSKEFEKSYRLLSESQKQWDLRKKFLERYWNQYDEDRLLCLAR
ncbi:unnamed protein product [Adineta ricciae]|uniref:XRN2-binding (XTBD) domain-containing protein n=1 Tax=Adineta ricciae TaxID=249248 RepID=A0A816BL24_ADIRI|nr:unnamed protein product [Adineta ricciae]